MIQEIKRNSVDALTKELSSLSTDELKTELASLWELSAQRLVKIAAILRVLEDRGEDLSEIKSSMLHYLRKIAFGQLIPEAVEQFAGQPLLLSRVSQLPIPDQERVASGQPLKLVVLKDDATDHRMIEPTKLRASEIRQIFARDHIRDDGEQASWLREKQTTSISHAAKSDIEVDAKRRELIVRGARITVPELITYLARLSA